MNLIAALVAGYICFSLELGLRKAISIGASGISPSFVFILCVVVCMSAPPTAAMWACLLMGLLTDLTWPHELVNGVSTQTFIGPYAIGYLVAGQFVIGARREVFRGNPFALGVLAAFGLAIAHVLIVAIYTFRSRYTPELDWQPIPQLLARFGDAVYTGVVGTLVGLFMGPLTSALGLHQPPQRRFTRQIF